MLTVYTICALAGSLMLLLFLIMSAMGMGGDADVDGALDGAVDGGLDAAAQALDGSLEGAPDGVGDAVDQILAQDHAAAKYEMLEDTASSSSSFFFQVLSFRSAVAAVAFFGLGGRVADAGGAGGALTFLVALTCALAAMVLVAWIMQALYSLREDGTVRVANTLGAPANVYLAVPGARGGVGKVTLTVQNRSMEYDAMTDGAPIPTGSRVVVAGVINDSTLLVKQG